MTLFSQPLTNPFAPSKVPPLSFQRSRILPFPIFELESATVPVGHQDYNIFTLMPIANRLVVDLSPEAGEAEVLEEKRRLEQRRN